MADLNGGIIGVDNPPVEQPAVITTFNSSGTLTTASYATTVEYLVIAGGQVVVLQLVVVAEQVDRYRTASGGFRLSMLLQAIQLL
jgi:hypothetical protein